MTNRYQMWWLGLVVGSVFTVPAEAALLGRLPATPGGTDYRAAYDDVLDITWVTDAGLSGLRTWPDMFAWAEGLSLLGANDWRLASMSVSAGVPTGNTDSVVDCETATELACRDNELGYMYYHNLASILVPDKTGTQTVGDVTLTNIQTFYWSGTEISLGTAWNFSFDSGDNLDQTSKASVIAGWAVRDGDIGLPSDPVDLTGTVQDTGGTPLCSMVLASGQFMFTCNPNGPYSLLDLPRKTDGTVKRQVYVDGFFPNIEDLPDSVDETVVMTRSGTCPNYNTPYDAGVFPDSAGNRIDIAGMVLLQDTQTPICAMVLANGQFMFSCDGTGSYALNIPLDNNGQFKLQVYADGFAPTIQTFDEFKTTNNVRMARAVECQ